MGFRIGKIATFATPKRCGSSAWLEYMPVTHGVASSSLVRTAKKGGTAVPPFFCPLTQKETEQPEWAVPSFGERRCAEPFRPLWRL